MSQFNVSTREDVGPARMSKRSMTVYVTDSSELSPNISLLPTPVRTKVQFWEREFPDGVVKVREVRVDFRFSPTEDMTPLPKRMTRSVRKAREYLEEPHTKRETVYLISPTKEAVASMRRAAFEQPLNDPTGLAGLLMSFVENPRGHAGQNAAFVLDSMVTEFPDAERRFVEELRDAILSYDMPGVEQESVLVFVRRAIPPMRALINREIGKYASYYTVDKVHISRVDEDARLERRGRKILADDREVFYFGDELESASEFVDEVMEPTPAPPGDGEEEIVFDLDETSGFEYSEDIPIPAAGADLSFDDLLERARIKRPWIGDDDVDPDELRQGIEVEMEHTSDPRLAKIIALIHLQEGLTPDKVKRGLRSDYYRRLKRVEKDIERSFVGREVEAEEQARATMPVPGASEMFDKYVAGIARQTGVSLEQVRNSPAAYKFAKKMGLVK